MSLKPSLQSNITTRISLRWLPEPPFENTDTLVLAIGEWYVDLRVEKQSGKIDWAIAGQCLRRGENPRQIVFTHAIDSHNDFNVSEPCPFVPLPNGDDLETGAMPRPDMAGAPVTDYEEVWRYLPIREGPEGLRHNCSLILESDDGVLGEGHYNVEKAFLARIGGTYLALHQKQVHQRRQTTQGWKVKVTAGDVSARREEWVGQGWEEKYSLGPNTCDLPSMAKAPAGKNQNSWHPGKKVYVGDRRYIVRASESLAQSTSCKL